MIKNLFDIIKNITNIKSYEDLGTEIYSPYMVNRFLSMDENYFIYALTMNRYFNLPKDIQEYFLFLTIPKKYVFLKYIKKSKNINDEILKDIQDKFNLSDKKTIELVEFLNKLNSIKNKGEI